jgi:antitoxin component YwqK of YwqJK toxin-antitoxin module
VHVEHAYRAGREHGVRRTYYPSGRPWTQGDWLDGQQDGSFQSYWPNGVKAVEGRYVRGTPAGRWATWDESGASMDPIDHGAER